MKNAIETRAAPAAIGPYSQAVDDGEMVFCSGQIGLEPASRHLVEGGVAAEVRCAFGNLREVLSGAGLGFDDVVKTTVFLVDLDEFEIVNLVYGEHFAAPYPARSTVQMVVLPRNARVEIEVIARRARQSRQGEAG